MGTTSREDKNSLLSQRESYQRQQKNHAGSDQEGDGRQTKYSIRSGKKKKKRSHQKRGTKRTLGSRKRSAEEHAKTASDFAGEENIQRDDLSVHRILEDISGIRN